MLNETPKILQRELDKFRTQFNLNSILALDLITHGLPEDISDYRNLPFRFIRGGIGRHGIIWLLPDKTYEMIIDNHPGKMVGGVSLFTLDEKGTVQSIQEIYRR